jgi:hypothetical protein
MAISHHVSTFSSHDAVPLRRRPSYASVVDEAKRPRIIRLMSRVISSRGGGVGSEH